MDEQTNSEIQLDLKRSRCSGGNETEDNHLASVYASVRTRLTLDGESRDVAICWNEKRPFYDAWDFFPSHSIRQRIADEQRAQNVLDDKGNNREKKSNQAA